jgi:tRNA modification GTPase
VLLCAGTAADVARGTAAVRAHGDADIIVVATKQDLVSQGDEVSADVAVSAHTGAGLRELLALIETRLTSRHGTPTLDAPALTSARQQFAVSAARAELRAFETAWRDDALPPSIAAIHVRAAADALGELIGSVRVDDVLDVVFASFCVGK